MGTLIKVIAAAMFYGPFVYITAVGIHNTIKDRSKR